MDHPLLNHLLPLSGRTPDKHPMISQEWEEGSCVAMPPGMCFHPYAYLVEWSEEVQTHQSGPGGGHVRGHAPR